MCFNLCDHGGSELILRILLTANYSPTCIFACSVITANTNKHIILCRRKMFWLSACAGKSIVFINGSHKTVTEIAEKNYISGSIWHNLFIQMLKYYIFEDRSFYPGF